MNIRTLTILSSGALTHWGALAHQGHGLPDSAHWHATDVLGFVGLGLVVVAVWFLGKGK